jgi:hypothetical protein
MCPFCLSSAIGLVIAGAVSTGGLTALAVKLSGRKNNGNETIRNSSERSSQDVNPNRR